MGSLIFTSGPNAGRRFALAGAELVIGRRSDCQVHIPDLHVSRLHARLRHEGARWIVEDLASTCGTYVNGQRIRRPTVLEDGDELALARSSMQVEIPPERDFATSNPDLAVVDLDRPRVYVSGGTDSDEGDALLRRQLLDRDLLVARQIQRSLLPAPGSARIPGLEVAFHYAPAYEIGGDFYDFIWHDEVRIALVIGDVAGKAISAALYMARLTSELRSRATSARSPQQLLGEVNDSMCALGDEGMFATLVYAVYDTQTRELVFTNAGHVTPLLRREGRVVPLHAERAHVPPVGFVSGVAIGETRVELRAGDLLLLATDGISEARAPGGAEYGLGRLARAVATGDTPAEVIGAILRDVERHVAGARQADDITLLAASVATGL